MQNSIVNLPPRPRGPYAEMFVKKEITTNHFKINLANIQRIVIFAMKIEPRIQSNDIQKRQSLQNEIKSHVSSRIRKPVFRGFCIYATEEYSEPFTIQAGGHQVTISQRKVLEVAAHADVFRLFLNSTLRYMMSDLGYIEIGKSGKYFNPKRCDNVDNLHCFKGYCSSFLECENGMYLRVDTARKMVRKDTVLDLINSIYAQNASKDKEEKRNEVRKALINSIILTNYGKLTFYRVLDVEFIDLTTYVINDQYPNLKDYY
jgi:hypothetical protein